MHSPVNEMKLISCYSAGFLQVFANEIKDLFKTFYDLFHVKFKTSSVQEKVYALHNHKDFLLCNIHI